MRIHAGGNSGFHVQGTAAMVKKIGRRQIEIPSDCNVPAGLDFGELPAFFPLPYETYKMIKTAPHAFR